MKPIHVILISLSTGILGFLTGGGLGLLGGSFGGNVVGGIAGSCIVLETATEMDMLTPEQAQKIGQAVGAQFKVEGKKDLISPADVEKVKGSTPSCNQFIQGIMATAK